MGDPSNSNLGYGMTLAPPKVAQIESTSIEPEIRQTSVLATFTVIPIYRAGERDHSIESLLHQRDRATQRPVVEVPDTKRSRRERSRESPKAKREEERSKRVPLLNPILRPYNVVAKSESRRGAVGLKRVCRRHWSG